MGQQLLVYARDANHLAAHVVIDRDVVAQHGYRYAGSGVATQAADRLLQVVRFYRDTVDGDDPIATPDAGARGGRAGYRCDDL